MNTTTKGKLCTHSTSCLASSSRCVLQSSLVAAHTSGCRSFPSARICVPQTRLLGVSTKEKSKTRTSLFSRKNTEYNETLSSYSMKGMEMTTEKSSRLMKTVLTNLGEDLKRIRKPELGLRILDDHVNG